MQTYETIFITPPDFANEKLDNLLEKLKELVTRQGGEMTSVEKWGRRRLAYPIARHPEGFYVLMVFKAPSTVLAELTQFFRVTDDVFRHLTCKAVRTRGDVTPRVPVAARPATETAAPAGAPVAEPPAAAPQA